MKHNAYTLYDVKSLTYSPPFYAPAHGVACRMLEELVADLGTTVGRHPRDFTLYCIGHFDDASGELLQLQQREHISDAVAFVRNQPASSLFQRSDRAGDEHGVDKGNGAGGDAERQAAGVDPKGRMSWTGDSSYRRS